MNVHIPSDSIWRTQEDIAIAGRVVYEGERYTGTQVCRLFERVNTERDLREVLEMITGRYAVIIDRGDTLFAAADHIRHIPIFYAERDNEVLLSPDYTWLSEELDPKQISSKTAIEFVFATYLPGRDTFHPDIRKLQAGEILTASIKKGQIETSLSTHFHITDEEERTTDSDELQSQLDDVLLSVFRRFQTVVAGRPVLLGLSGGYDSRLIALMLYRMGFDEVIAYTHNTQSERDIRIARELVDQLGFDWIQLDHTHEEIRKGYEQYYYGELGAQIGHHGELPVNVANCLTLRKLAADDRVPDDAVFTKGHTIAEAGKRIPADMLSQTNIGSTDLADIIIEKYYQHAKVENNFRPTLRQIALDRTRVSDEPSVDEAIEAIDSFYWRERLPKFLMTSLYEYEYWNFDCALPFIDREYLSFYASLPPAAKQDRTLYEEYTDHLTNNLLKDPGIYDRDNSTDLANTLDIRSVIEDLVTDTPVEGVARSINQAIKVRRIDYSDTGILFAYVDEDVYKNIYTGFESFRTFLALDELYRSPLQIEDLPVYLSPQPVNREVPEQT